MSRQVTSPDLRQWTIRETLLETDEGMAEEDVWRYTSFSYVDWQFEGPDVRSPPSSPPPFPAAVLVLPFRRRAPFFPAMFYSPFRRSRC